MALEKLPHRRPDRDESSEKRPSDPVVRIDRSILIDRSVSFIGREKYVCRDLEKPCLYLGIGIDRRDESMFRIESFYFLILFHCIGDIGSLYFPFSLESLGMYDIHDLYSFSTMELEDFLCMHFSLLGSCLRREEDRDRLSILVLSREYREDALFDDIVWLSIDGDDDDMFQIFARALYRLIVRKIPLLILQKLQIGLQYIEIRLKYLHRPVGDIERDEEKPRLIVYLHQDQREEKYPKER